MKPDADPQIRFVFPLPRWPIYSPRYLADMRRFLNFENARSLSMSALRKAMARNQKNQLRLTDDFIRLGHGSLPLSKILKLDIEESKIMRRLLDEQYALQYEIERRGF